ncbi:hypothetical protein [Anaerocolumna sp. MB42-C2]|uniref:hypothetical protein n=1 Tax=Anaerocolumna sp. MB42-C2 TaxID=3070997 RepID=UPI0027DFC5A1|nr:hypothetical protein [Anaerocolumna sp. MB42-C2]WMJ90227.1 hypothetical protein RBU59_12070 [Anaerocolumna sp. MB42-C2]
MEDTEKIIQTAILAIEEVTVLFYQQQENLGYNKLNLTLNKIELALNEIFRLKNDNNEIQIDEQKIIGRLSDAMEALAIKDSVLLADILQYEIAEQFKNIIEQL